jgi:TP901 family phage tail tape measure protein
MAEETKDLGLGVLFSASIGDFTSQITAIQDRLKSFAKEIEAYGKISEKSVADLTAATTKANKAATAANDTADKLNKQLEASNKKLKNSIDEKATAETKATSAAKAHSKTLEDVRADMKGLDAATTSQIASSKMSLPVYDSLQKKLAANSKESVGFRYSLAQLAMEQGQTKIGFENLASALVKNEKTILDTNKGFDDLRKTVGPSGLPANFKNWAANVDRVQMAHATLRGELKVSDGVIIEAGKSVIGTQHAVRALENEFGKDNVSKYRTQIGSSINTMSEFKNALVANQKEQLAMNTHVTAAQKAISGVENTMNAMNAGAGTRWRNNVNESGVAADFLRGNLSRANGVILQAGESFEKTQTKVDNFGKKFKTSLSMETITTLNEKVGTTIKTFGEYEKALTRAAASADETGRRNKQAGELVREMGTKYHASANSVDYLAKKVSEGTISFDRASKIIKEHSDRSNALKAANRSLADQTAILSNKFKDLLAPTSKYREEAQKMIGSMEAGRASMTITYDNLNRLQKAYNETQKGMEKWRTTTETFSNSSDKMRDKLSRLQTQIDAGTISHKQASDSATKYAKEIGELGNRAGKATGSINGLTQGIMGGGAASKLAVNYMTRLGVAVRSLAAWGVGAAIIGTFTAAISDGITAIVEFDQALKNLSAISDGTEAQIQDLGEEMLRLSETTKYSASEISKGAIFIAQAGFTANETLHVISSAAKLAQGTMSDMATTTDLLTTVLRVFQVPARESAYITDKLAVAANKSKTDIEGLKTAFNYLGPVARAAGLSLDGTLATIMALANAGIKMSTIGTSMRQVISRLENPTAKLRNAIHRAGMSIEDFSFKTHTLGEVAANMAKIVQGDAGNALSFFGERAGNAALIISNLGPHMDTLVGYMKEMGAASEMAGKQAEGLGVKISILRNKFQNLFISFGEGGFANILKLLIDALTKLIDVISVLAQSKLVQFVAIWGLVKVAVIGVQMALRGLTTIGLASWVGISRDAIATSISTMGIWTTVITTVSTAFKNLIAISLASYLNTTREAILTAISNFGIFKTVLSGVGSQAVTLTGILAALRAGIAALMGTLGFWITLTAAVVFAMVSLSNAHKKEADELVNKSQKYQESALQLQDYAARLREMSEKQKEGNDVQLENIALMKEIREKIPEVTAEMLNGAMSIDKQAEAMDKLAISHEKLAETKAKESVKLLTEEMSYASEEIQAYTKRIEENTSAWASFRQVFHPFQTYASWVSHFNTVVWGLGETLHLTRSKADMWATALGINMQIVSKRIETLAQVIGNQSPKMREEMLKSIPSEDYKKKIQAIIAMNDQYQALLQARTDFSTKMQEEYKNSVERLGETWQAYFMKQDELGAKEVMTIAANTAKKIAIKEKELEKAGNDQAKRQEILDQIAEIDREAYTKMIETRAKKVDEMLKLMDDFYQKEENSIKAAAENQRRVQELARDNEINALNLRFEKNEEYYKEKANIEEKYLLKTKEIIDDEAKASIDAAENIYNQKKDFLNKQTLLENDEAGRQKLLVAEQQHSEKLVNIYKNQLTQYKSIMDQRRQAIEQYRQAAIQAEKDIMQAEREHAQQMQTLEEIKRNAMQLTMNQQQKAQDDVARYEELMTKFNETIIRANEAGAKGNKDLYDSLRAEAKNYVDEATRMIGSLKVYEEDTSKKTAEAAKQARKDQKQGDLDYYNELKGIAGTSAADQKTFIESVSQTQQLHLSKVEASKAAYDKLNESAKSFGQSEIDRNKELATKEQERYQKLMTDYDAIQKKYEQAIVINMDNSKAIEAIDALSQKIMSTPFKVTVTFMGKASPEDTLENTIAEVVSKLDGLVTSLGEKTAAFTIQFMGTLGTLADRQALNTITTGIMTNLTNLTANIQAITPPSLTFWFWAEDGAVKDRFMTMYTRVKDTLTKLVSYVTNELFPKFVIKVIGSDSGVETDLTTLAQSIYTRFDRLTNQINSMKPIYRIITEYVTVGSAPSTTTGTGFAEGGSVPGEGDGDTVPSMLTPGEYVISKPTVNAFGTAFFDMINSIKSGFSVPRMTTSGIPAFAGGGAVGPLETFNLNLTVGSERIPLKVIGNPDSMRNTVKRLEKELAKLKLSRG